MIFFITWLSSSSIVGKPIRWFIVPFLHRCDEYNSNKPLSVLPRYIRPTLGIDQTVVICIVPTTTIDTKQLFTVLYPNSSTVHLHSRPECVEG
jgi:hypothetical protein